MGTPLMRLTSAICVQHAIRSLSVSSRRRSIWSSRSRNIVIVVSSAGSAWLSIGMDLVIVNNLLLAPLSHLECSPGDDNGSAGHLHDIDVISRSPRDGEHR